MNLVQWRSSVATLLAWPSAVATTIAHMYFNNGKAETSKEWAMLLFNSKSHFRRLEIKSHF